MTETSKTALLCTFTFLAAGVISWAVVSKRSPQGEVDATPSIIAPSTSTPHEEHVPDLLTLSENELAVTLWHLTSAQIRRAIRPITASNMADIHRQSVLKAALEALAAKDPKHFLHWIDTADLSLALSTPAIELAASILAQGDPEESFTTIKAMSSKRMGYIATLAYGTALAHHAPETAVEQMIEAGALLDVGRTAGAVWAAKDPKAAANYFTSIHGKQMVAMQTGIRAVMAEWASQDPEGALEWTKTGTDLLARRLASNYLLNALADDPKTADTALQYISELPAGSQRTMLMSSLGWNFRQHDTFDETLLAKAIEIGNPTRTPRSWPI